MIRLRLRFAFKSVGFLVSTLLLSGSLNADSLWKPGFSPYGAVKHQVRVGDTVRVRISESTSAVQEATTKTSKGSSIGSDSMGNWNQVASILGNETNRKNFQFKIGGNDAYQGQGQTSRRSRVESTLTAIVTEVLDGGNLFIIGEHEVKVNDETEMVRVSGIISPGDISQDNSVFSYQIAKAEISVHGSGVIGSKQTPGILTKMLNWFF